ncbi:12162_t:CDS:2 [Racocetra persica]|uniref:12162_t:CDS:1 n=1 Tax=Racocetra persica TaxID=160502 RepID=A0ACA9KIV1_9GLOM|nr:12162_t:CDS:2 [Racocetra persica]
MEEFCSMFIVFKSSLISEKDQMKVKHQNAYPNYEYRPKKKTQRHPHRFNALPNKKSNLPDEDITQIAKSAIKSAMLNSNPSYLPQFITSEVSQPPPLSPPPSFILEEEFLNYSTTAD